MEGYGLWAGDAPAVDLVKEVLDNLGNITTLILSNATIEPCLLALEANTGAVNNAQGFSQVQTLIIHSDAGKDPSETDVLRALLPVARKRKATGNPFNCLGVSSPSPEPVLIAGME